MPIKIGMRTIKTAICAALGIFLAQQLGLVNPASAGIIALLSVTNSKRSSFETGFFRVCSLALATIVSVICFSLLGYHALAFGVYLLVFIPLAVKGKMTEGIPVSSVLVTHYLSAGAFSWSLVYNAFMLLFLGVGLALLANLIMPDFSEQLQKEQAGIDQKIRDLLLGMSNHLKQDTITENCDVLLKKVIIALAAAEEKAQRHEDNQLLSVDSYYLDYFAMRRLQVNLLTRMNELVKEIDGSETIITGVQGLLQTASATFSKNNDGQALLELSRKVLNDYRQAPLPLNREEFENRARLYQLLNEFQRFIEIKRAFTTNQFPLLKK